MAEGVFNEFGEFSSDRIENYSYEQLTNSCDDLLMSIRDLQREYGDNEKTPNGVKVMYEKIETKLDAIEDERESRRDKKQSGPKTVSTQKQLENARRLHRFREWARTDAADRNRFREWAKMDALEQKQQEEDMSRLERFKKWAKENMAGLAGIAISIAGVITIIIVSARSVITKGAHATNKFAWNVYHLGWRLRNWVLF